MLRRCRGSYGLPGRLRAGRDRLRHRRRRGHLRGFPGSLPARRDRMRRRSPSRVMHLDRARASQAFAWQQERSLPS